MSPKLRIQGLGVLFALFIAGCGGYEGPKSTTITGTVLDIDNQPVRGAKVWTPDQTTYTTEAGSYVMAKNREGEVEIRAEIKKDGITYKGRTFTLGTVNQQVNNANIIVAADTDLASSEGYVYDREGFPLQHASIFAYSGAGSSQRAFTDSDGYYKLDDLVSNISYQMSAGGPGYRSDQDTVTLAKGELRRLDFIVSNAGTPTLHPPQNIFASSWVSHSSSRGGAASPSIDFVKTLLEKRKSHATQDGKVVASKQTRAITGTTVEVDLEWNENQFPDLLGYGVYRANSSGGTLVGVDFVPEPLAAFYVDLGLNPLVTYSYALTTLSAWYPDTPETTESALSDRVVVSTLDLLDANVSVSNNPTFGWSTTSGAELPSIGVSSIWSSSYSTGSSLVYGGPQLLTGHRYYYFVVGVANYDSNEGTYTSRTISQLQSFTY